MSTIYALPQAHGTHAGAREKAVATAMQELAAELKLIDVVELVCLCHADKHANIDDLVDSAAELLFKKDTIRYGGAAEADLHWDMTPALVLDMEFRHEQIMMLFKLRLGTGDPSVAITQIVFTSFSGSPEAATDLLVSTLADARLNYAAGIRFI